MDDLLLIFDKTIATFVEISELNFSGGSSVFMPASELGNINSLLDAKSSRINLIFSKYSSKIFILFYCKD